MTKAEKLALEISYATSDVDISYDDWLLKLENLQAEREGAWNKMSTITEEFRRFEEEDGIIWIYDKNNKGRPATLKDIEKFWLEKIAELQHDLTIEHRDELYNQEEEFRKQEAKSVIDNYQKGYKEGSDNLSKILRKELKEKDQVINKLIEDRPFDIKDALAEQKKDLEMKYEKRETASIFKALMEQRGLIDEEWEDTMKRIRKKDKAEIKKTLCKSCKKKLDN